MCYPAGGNESVPVDTVVFVVTLCFRKDLAMSKPLEQQLFTFYDDNMDEVGHTFELLVGVGARIDTPVGSA